jgi:CDP-diacylglycerol---glycerol-3-phosphate 3-phosphatidyltransferase
VVAVLLAVSEYAGVMGPMVGASRRYDGPSGKSDRALVLAPRRLDRVGLGLPLPAGPGILMWLIAVLARAHRRQPRAASPG